jgi:peptidoglycan/xylan/chitin deacetylase (PgdA/CDA1 family)
MRLGVGRSVVKALAAGADVVRPPPPGLVVLIYHRVGRRVPIETDLPLGLFEEQIDFLCEHAEVVSLANGLSALDRTEPRRGERDPWQVALTFDDGTADFEELVLPTLTRSRLPATLYLATAFVEERRPFHDDGVPMSWSAVRDAQSTGLVSVGSHTHRHALLDRLPPDDVDDELDRSIELIGDRLGVAPADFAYPKAVLGSPIAEGAVRKRFRSAALAGNRPNPFGATDPYRLARSPVQVSDGMHWFRRKVRGGLELEARIRGIINRRRYRHVST